MSLIGIKIIFTCQIYGKMVIKTKKIPNIASDKSKLCHHPQLRDRGYQTFDQGV